MLVQRHLNGDREFALLKGLENVAEGIGDLGTLQRVVVGIRGQVHDRQAVQLPDAVRCGDAIHITLQHDVHQHEVRPVPPCFGDGLSRGRRYGNDRISATGQPCRDILCDDVLVLYDKDRSLGHPAALRSVMGTPPFTVSPLNPVRTCPQYPDTVRQNSPGTIHD